MVNETNPNSANKKFQQACFRWLVVQFMRTLVRLLLLCSHWMEAMSSTTASTIKHVLRSFAKSRAPEEEASRMPRPCRIAGNGTRNKPRDLSQLPTMNL